MRRSSFIFQHSAFHILHCALPLVFAAFAADANGATPLATSATVSFAMNAAGDGEFVDGGFVIARRGTAPDCAIVVATNSDPLVQYAAKELQTFTKRMTGVELPIVPSATGKTVTLDYAGEPPAPPGGAASSRAARRDAAPPNDGQQPISLNRLTAQLLNADAFQIKTDGQGLVISGGGPRGVLYGVYELLERFGGCEWYSSWVEEIPGREVFSVPARLDFFDAPAFEERDVLWCDVVRHPEFAARMRFNGQFNRKFPAGGPALPFLKGIDAKRPGQYQFQLAHSYQFLAPPKEHYAEHPEWYSLVKGRRLGTNEWWQFCWSNKELQSFIAERLKALLREDPGARAVGIGQNDWRNYCECPECASCTEEEESPAGPSLRFVNAIADEVGKEFPDVMLLTLAYHGTRKPPKTIRPRPNVGVVLCSFECSFTEPFATSSHTNSRKFAQYVRDWGAICPVYVWDYTVNFCNYLMPFPNDLSLQPNYKLFHDNGVRWLFTQGCDGGAHCDMAELKTWLQSKLMWNPDQDAAPLIDRFLKGFYGPAEPFVRKYLDDLHAALRMTRDPDPSAAPAAVGLYGENLPVSDAFIEEALATWLKAEEAAAADPVRRFNARVGALPMLYVRLKRRYEESKKTVWCAEDLAPHVAAYGRIQPLAADFVKRVDEVVNGVEGVKGKDGFTLAEVYSKYQRLMRDFRELAKWTAPTSGCDRAEVNGKGMSYSKGERTWRLPLRLIACDVGATYGVRARLRARGQIEAGTEVPGLPFAAGHSRKKLEPDPSGDWAWYDIGEYDIVGLQNLPRPTMNGPAFFVRGDIDFDCLEIAKVK